MKSVIVFALGLQRKTVSVREMALEQKRTQIMLGQLFSITLFLHLAGEGSLLDEQLDRRTGKL